MQSRFILGLCLIFWLTDGWSMRLSGKLFFNSTGSGHTHERFLLNQQFSSFKIFIDHEFSQKQQLHAIIIHNQVPTPMNQAFFFDEIYWMQPIQSSMAMTGTIGKKWLPFGRYKNDLIHKPFTKALGQTNANMVELHFGTSWYAKLALSQLHSQALTSFMPLNFTLNVGYQQENNQGQSNLGLSYLHQLTDTQLFQYNKGFGGYLGQEVNNVIPGLAGYYHYQRLPWNFYITAISALKAFNVADVSYQGYGAKPTVLSIQVGYAFNLLLTQAKLIGFADQSMQTLALGIPKKRLGLALNLYPSKAIEVQTEYYKDYPYPITAKSQGLHKNVVAQQAITHVVALQLVIHFN